MLQLNLWDKTQKKKWNLINVYGAGQEENKDEFLAELVRFCDANNEPVLIGGDSNIIRFASEKNKKMVFMLTLISLMQLLLLMSCWIHTWWVAGLLGLITSSIQL